MNIQPEVCYSAIKSRDARFDGQFFTAVLTTGIYCRPICPARTPLAKNVRFFKCAAAAELAGFRPCLRCRPESAPGTHDATSTIARALQLIHQGILDQNNLEILATKLAITPRHLRRIFQKTLGTSPIAIAQTRRLHFAKKLLDETDLPMVDIAFCAGFASLRRFNTLFAQTFKQNPTAIRKQREIHLVEKTNLFLKLAYRPPLDWVSLLEFMQARAIPGVENIKDDTYRRTVQFGEVVGIIEVSYVVNKNYLRLKVPSILAKYLMQIVERIQRQFDLKADPQQIATHLSQDPRLAPLIKKFPGMRLPGGWDSFEMSVRTILGQHISIKAANTLMSRLVQTFGIPLEDLTLFPGVEILAQADLSTIGMTQKRSETIRKLAQAVVSGSLNLSTVITLEQIIAQLVAMPGIGIWSAHCIAMHGFGEPNAFPVGDLALQRALSDETGKVLTPSEILRRSETWQPWRAYATLYLWKEYLTLCKSDLLSNVDYSDGTIT
jgi:AraC family transcriptional regulator, regulatory protein of adaptative response / DNA-3-methyladenine glycosylase II